MCFKPKLIKTPKPCGSSGGCGLPDDRWIKAVNAFVVLVKDSGLTPEDVIAHCREKLGKFEVPKWEVFVENFPVTSTGKVRKNVLRKEFFDHVQL